MGTSRRRRPLAADAPAAAALTRTSMGWICAVARRGRLLATTLPMSSRQDALEACPARGDLTRPEAVLTRLAEDLRRYFAGEPVDLARYPVDLSEQPPFRRAALRAAQQIARGKTRSYAWVAARAGRPGAARAAGQAMSRNVLPLVVPCHRVVAADGSLGGFGGGLTMKKKLLALEGVHIGSQRPRR